MNAGDSHRPSAGPATCQRRGELFQAGVDALVPVWTPSPSDCVLRHFLHGGEGGPVEKC